MELFEGVAVEYTPHKIHASKTMKNHKSNYGDISYTHILRQNRRLCLIISASNLRFLFSYIILDLRIIFPSNSQKVKVQIWDQLGWKDYSRVENKMRLRKVSLQ